MNARMNLHGSAQVIVGDETDHGGVVITGSPTHSWHGIPIARKGDRVFCPKCKPHIFEICEGLGNATDTDLALPMATEGHKTTCGAVLIARSAPAAALREVLHFTNGSGFDDRYVLRDETGQAMANTYYGAKMPDGHLEFATTDAYGHTHMYLSGEQAKHLLIYLAG
jgi:uncharacterized Zn-binding protein involved in type VI secretion